MTRNRTNDDMAATCSHWCINKFGNYDRKQADAKKWSTIASAEDNKNKGWPKLKWFCLPWQQSWMELIAFVDLWPTAQMQLVLKSPLSHLVSDSKFV